MKPFIVADELSPLLLENIPLLDVRSPAEYLKGSLPGSTNLPLLNDAEREAIGLAYKQNGQAAAISLGQKLVAGDIRQQRIQTWIEFLNQYSDSVLYCFRGGLRSKIAQQWLAEAGYEVPRIAGGYKAVRRLLLNSIEEACEQLKFLLIAGKTGCGKTLLLAQFENQIDLEGLANHRGSAFGNRSTVQPNQVSFENRLALALIKLPFTAYQRLVLEDESRAIGSLSIPLKFSQQMNASPIAVIEQDQAFRVETILNAYIVANYSEFKTLNPETVEQQFSDYLFGSLQRIKKRLGAGLYAELVTDMNLAVKSHHGSDDISGHRMWIAKLLTHYYDPMYDYQLNKKLARIVFRGSSDEFLCWARNLQYTRAQ